MSCITQNIYIQAFILSRLITLKFNPVGNVPDAHGVVSAKDDFFSECLHPILEVSGRQENISPHNLVLLLLDVVLEVLFPGYFYRFPVNCHFNSHILFPRMVDAVVHLAVHLFQLRREVGAPPHVARSEGEEDLQAMDQNIVEFYMNVSKSCGPNDVKISRH